MASSFLSRSFMDFTILLCESWTFPKWGIFHSLSLLFSSFNFSFKTYAPHPWISICCHVELTKLKNSLSKNQQSSVLKVFRPQSILDSLIIIWQWSEILLSNINLLQPNQTPHYPLDTRILSTWLSDFPFGQNQVNPQLSSLGTSSNPISKMN